MGLRTDLASILIKKTFNKRFSLAKLTKAPVIGRVMIWALFDKDDMIYLPKDEVAARSLSKEKTIEVNIGAEQTNLVLPSRVVEHFVNESRYIFIMNRCMCRNSNDCKDYPKDLGCIFLGRGILKIDRKFGRVASKAEALEHLSKARMAGLVHLIGRNKIDSVWLDTGPKEDLLSICNCCPCCCLWRMMPFISSEVSDAVTKMPGVEVVIDDDGCVGCGKCAAEGVCFVSAISIVDGKAAIDEARCRGCGRCVDACANGAIELRINDDAFFEKSVARIEPLVDIRAD